MNPRASPSRVHATTFALFMLAMLAAGSDVYMCKCRNPTQPYVTRTYCRLDGTMKAANILLKTSSQIHDTCPLKPGIMNTTDYEHMPESTMLAHESSIDSKQDSTTVFRLLLGLVFELWIIGVVAAILLMRIMKQDKADEMKTPTERKRNDNEWQTENSQSEKSSHLAPESEPEQEFGSAGHVVN